MACEDHVKSMREEKDRWKMQLQVSSVNDGFWKNVKSKMVGQRRHEPSPVVQPNAQDAQFLSNQYHDLMNSEASLDEDFSRMSDDWSHFRRMSPESTKLSTRFSVTVIDTT